MHWYAYARLVRDPDMPVTIAAIAIVWLAIGASAIPVAFARVVPPPWGGRVHRVAFSWMGALFIVTVTLVVGDSALALLSVVGGATTIDPVTLARSQATFTTIVAGTAIVRALYNGASPAPIRRVDLRLEGWPSTLDGLTVAVISDLHIAPGTSGAYVRALVERTNASKPDIIALCGDLVDGPVSMLEGAVRQLSGLRARLGTFAVTGNHEYFSGAGPWVTFLRGIGIDVLENTRRTVTVGTTPFDVAGVTDFAAGRFDNTAAPSLADALDGRNPTHPVLLLAHQPRQFDEAAALGVTLQVSGHTHGGQIWPFTLFVRLVDHRVAGVYRQGRSTLYVSRGVRYWGPPMRLGAPHELSLLTLRSG